MSLETQKRQSPRLGGLHVAHHNNFHAQSATAEPLLQRLDAVQKSGNGWRARCPACGGQGRKLSITESDGRVLLNCFGCGDAAAVLDAVGLRWADLMPPRNWPETPDERRRVRRAIRESGWASALDVVALESRVALIAAQQIHTVGGLQSSKDLARLAQAVERLGSAAAVLGGAR